MLGLNTVAQKKACLIFFTSDNTKFKIISNGIEVNNIPKSKVKLDSLFEQSYEIRIIFDKDDEIKERIYPKQCYQVSYVVKIADFERKLYWFGENKIRNCNIKPNVKLQDSVLMIQKHCAGQMSDAEFNALKIGIKNTDLENDKLKLAKIKVSKTCLKSRQARTIAALFDFEETKVAFAKFVYKRIIDKQKFSMINDVFDFASSIRELNKYIKAVNK